MKKFRRFSLPAALALTLGFGLPNAGLAQEAKVKAEDASKHYEAVAKHLEIGGVFYAYMDIDGDLKKLSQVIDDLLGFVRAESGGDFPEKLSAAGIANELGLDCVKAVGMSSRKSGNVFHNRAFMAIPGGRKGIFNVLGGKPTAFSCTKLAPAGADIVGEEDLKFSVVLEIVKNILQQIGDEELSGKFDDSLNQKMGPLDLSFGDFIKKLDIKVTIVASVDPAVRLDIDGPQDPLPMVDAIVCVENMGWLFDILKKAVEETATEDIESKSGDGFEELFFKKELPDAFKVYKPTLRYDKKSNRLILGSRPDYIDKCLAGASTVANDADFKKATAGLPAEGNGMSYVSSEALKEMWKFLDLAASQNGRPEAKEMMMKMWEMYLPKGDEPIASVRANLDDGVLFVSNSFDTHKSTIVTMMTYPLMMGGAAFGIVQRQAMMRQMGQQQQFQMEERPERDVPDEKLTPEQKIEGNLQQIAFAAEAYFLDHPKEKEVTYDQLIKGGFLFEVDPVAGESYKDLAVKRSGGTLQLKTKDGKKLEHRYPAVTD